MSRTNSLFGDGAVEQVAEDGSEDGKDRCRQEQEPGRTAVERHGQNEQDAEVGNDRFDRRFQVAQQEAHEQNEQAPDNQGRPVGGQGAAVQLAAGPFLNESNGYPGEHREQGGGPSAENSKGPAHGTVLVLRGEDMDGNHADQGHCPGNIHADGTPCWGRRRRRLGGWRCRGFRGRFRFLPQGTHCRTP
jgi:hypothetical protein